MELYEDIVVTGVNRDGTPYIGTMRLVHYASTKNTPLGIKWGVCSKCHFSFPVNEMQLVRGKYFCIKNKCYRDNLQKELK